MKHLNLELERLESRIAPGGIGLGGGVDISIGVEASGSSTCSTSGSKGSGSKGSGSKDS